MMEQDHGAPASGTGSHPSDQAPAGLGGVRFDPSRDEVIEECAKVAEATTAYDDSLQRSSGCGTTGERIAANLRAMKSAPDLAVTKPIDRALRAAHARSAAIVSMLSGDT